MSDIQPKHFIKLHSSKPLSEEEIREFVHTVRNVDSSVESYHEDDKHVVVELSKDMSDEELDNLFSMWAADHDDFFIIGSNQESHEQEEHEEETVQESAKEDPKPTEEKKAEPKKDMPKKDFKSVYEKMCEELEVKMHNRVIDKKSSLGWRFGNKFSPESKESPLMRPYHELPEEYKTKNGKIFNDVIDILEKHGFKVSLPKKGR